MKTSVKKSAKILAAALLVLFTACSSAPKRSMAVTTLQVSSAEFIQSANGAILSGNFEKADQLLNSAFSIAMSVDNCNQLSTICLARVSLCLSYNPPKIDDAKKYLAMADSYADYGTQTEKFKALVELGSVRIALEDETSTESADSLITKLDQNISAVKKDAYNEAQFKSVKGDVYKKAGKLSEAEASYRDAAKLYTDNRYLSELGISWYKISQVCSLNKKKSDALTAINNAIFYDRSAENSSALGADYYAKGLILSKTPYTPSQIKEADFCFQHSADIYNSIGMKDAAAKSAAKISGKNE